MFCCQFCYPSHLFSATILCKDNTIPKEWFHLPKGAAVPTVDDLLRDSSPEIANKEEAEKRAKSPPICGRQRSKSRERVPHKYQASSTVGLHQRAQTPIAYDTLSSNNITLAPSTYSLEPAKLSSNVPDVLPHSHDVNSFPVASESSPYAQNKNEAKSEISGVVQRPHESDHESESETSTSCFAMARKSRSRSKSKERKLNKDKLKKTSLKKDQANGETNGHKQTDLATNNKDPMLSVKSGPASQTLPPKVDRSSKPAANKPTRSTHHSDDEDGYEPIHQNDVEGKLELNKMPISVQANSQKNESHATEMRDSSRGSGYELFGWQTDGTTRKSDGGSKDELCSKIYEDLVEANSTINEMGDVNLAISVDPSMINIMEGGSRNSTDDQPVKETNLKAHMDKTEVEALANTINSSNVPDAKAEQIILEQKNKDHNKKAKQQEKEDREQKIQYEKEQKALKANQLKENKNREKERKQREKEEKEMQAKLKKQEEHEKKEQEEKAMKQKKKLEREEKEKLDREAKESKQKLKQEKERNEKAEKERKENELKERKMLERAEKENAEKLKKEQKKDEKPKQGKLIQETKLAEKKTIQPLAQKNPIEPGMEDKHECLSECTDDINEQPQGPNDDVTQITESHIETLNQVSNPFEDDETGYLSAISSVIQTNPFEEECEINQGNTLSLSNSMHDLEINPLPSDGENLDFTTTGTVQFDRDACTKPKLSPDGIANESEGNTVAKRPNIENIQITHTPNEKLDTEALNYENASMNNLLDDHGCEENRDEKVLSQKEIKKIKLEEKKAKQQLEKSIKKKVTKKTTISEWEQERSLA